VCRKDLIEARKEENRQIGNTLDDNSKEPTYYRYHDAIHLAFLAKFGWSPVMRKLLNRKRKSDPTIDNSEDGQVAWIIEERIAHAVYRYAEDNEFLRGREHVDTRLLTEIQGSVSRLEVGDVTHNEWENAVITSMQIWNELVKNRGGTVSLNLDRKGISYSTPQAI